MMFGDRNRDDSGLELALFLLSPRFRILFPSHQLQYVSLSSEPCPMLLNVAHHRKSCNH